MEHEREAQARIDWRRAAATTGALAVSAIMVMASLELRSTWDEQPATEPPAESPGTPPFSATRPTAPGTSGPRLSEPSVELSSGLLVDGNGLRFDANRARGVDCIPSYTPEITAPPPIANEIRLPLGLSAGQQILEALDPSRNTVFLGEETSRPRLGNYKLSHGWAVKPEGGAYIIYAFQVKSRPGSTLRAQAIGQPIMRASQADLRTGLMFRDPAMTFTAKIQTATPAGDQHLHLAIRCNEAPAGGQ